MVNVSKVFVALLVCFMRKECLVFANSISNVSHSMNVSDSSASVSSGSSDEQCDRGFVRCKIIGGEIGCVEICSLSTSRCEGLDVDNLDDIDEEFCLLVNGCPSTSTLVLVATETSLVASCNFPSGFGSCGIICSGSCPKQSFGCGSMISIPICSCTQPTCVPECS